MDTSVLLDRKDKKRPSLVILLPPSSPSPELHPTSPLDSNLLETAAEAEQKVCSY
ncbi:hypothetical protein YC2023_090621 [Brassica napus]